MYPTTDHDTQPFLFPPDPSDTSPPQPPLPGSGSDGREPRPRRGGVLIAGIAATALVAGTVGGLIGAHEGGTSGTTSSLVSSSGGVAAPAAAPRSYAAIASKVLPAVVNIDVAGQGQSDTGTGVIIRSDGYILTNNHVVSAADGGGAITVTFNDGSHASATIRGTDPTYDLAVIKVGRTGLTTAAFGQSSSVRVGDPVLAVGSPLGLSGTVTSGIVSALNRAVETTDSQQQSNIFGQQTATATVINAIQTDAAINPGNSGGPLIDAAGQVIGINSAIASLGSSSGGQSGSIGLGFAIPIDQARYIAQQLIASGHATHPILGVSLPVDTTTSSTTDGVVVGTVEAGKPAAKAGIKSGDVILAVDGTPVNTSDALIATIRSYRPGEKVQLTYRHGSTRHTVTVTLADSTSDG